MNKGKTSKTHESHQGRADKDKLWTNHLIEKKKKVKTKTLGRQGQKNRRMEGTDKKGLNKDVKFKPLGKFVKKVC